MLIRHRRAWGEMENIVELTLAKLRICQYNIQLPSIPKATKTFSQQAKNFFRYLFKFIFPFFAVNVGKTSAISSRQWLKLPFTQ